MVRSVGIRKDMRLYRSETYASYWFLSLNSFVGKRGDSYDRFLIRVREMYESINIVFQVLSNLINFSKNPKSVNTKLDFFSFLNFYINIGKIHLIKKLSIHQWKT
jgi:NADH:ubiquinone oxidoreductase subunit D